MTLQDALADNQRLRATVADQQARIDQFTRLVEGLQGQLRQTMIALATLQAEVAAKTGKKRGPKAAEAPAPDTDAPDPPLDPAALRRADREARKARRHQRKKAKGSKKKPRRKSLPAHLQRVEKREELSACIGVRFRRPEGRAPPVKTALLAFYWGLVPHG